MTLFEYLSVAVSIVLSLSAAQILSSIRASLRSGTRYWVHAFWMFAVLYTHVVVWWEFWAYRSVVDWSLSMFVLLLVVPGLLFVISHTLATPDSEHRGSWEQHFYAVRRSFFAMSCGLLVISVVRDAVLLDRAIVEMMRPFELGWIACYAAGAIFADRRLQIGIVLAHVTLTVVNSVTVLAAPGGASAL